MPIFATLAFIILVGYCGFDMRRYNYDGTLKFIDSILEIFTLIFYLLYMFSIFPGALTVIIICAANFLIHAAGAWLALRQQKVG